MAGMRLQPAPRFEQHCLVGLAHPVGVAFGRVAVDHGRASPVGWASFSALDAHAGSGGGRGLSMPMRRRISANSDRVTATSASWNTT